MGVLHVLNLNTFICSICVFWLFQNPKYGNFRLFFQKKWTFQISLVMLLPWVVVCLFISSISSPSPCCLCCWWSLLLPNCELRSFPKVNCRSKATHGIAAAAIGYPIMLCFKPGKSSLPLVATSCGITSPWPTEVYDDRQSAFDGRLFYTWFTWTELLSKMSLPPVALPRHGQPRCTMTDSQLLTADSFIPDSLGLNS